MVGHGVHTAKGGKMGANPCLSGRIQGILSHFKLILQILMLCG